MTNIDVLKKWVIALRSGQYKQGRSFLCRDNQYCCLGVLCEICKLDKIIDSGITIYSDGFNTSKKSLPDSFARKLNICISPFISTKNIDYKYHINNAHPIAELAGLNDSNVPFIEIADLIEKHLIPTVKEVDYDEY